MISGPWQCATEGQPVSPEELAGVLLRGAEVLWVDHAKTDISGYALPVPTKI